MARRQLTRQEKSRQAEYQRCYRAERKAKGLCVSCPRPAREGLVQCEIHAGQSARRVHEQREKLFAAGLCFRCGEKPARPDRKSCERCGELAVVRQGKIFRQRKRKGICGYGTCPNLPERKKTMCREHLERLKNSNYKLYANRLAAGLCRMCGRRPLLFGDSAHCLFCRIVNRSGKFSLPLKMHKVIRQFWRLDRIDQRRKQAEAAIEHVPDGRVQKILSLRQGLADGIDHTLEEVGEQFQVTRERIRQIEERAYRFLRSINVPTDLMLKPSDKQRPRLTKKRRVISKSKARKLRAQRLASQAVKNGTLIRRPCERCGALKTLAHHHDYSKPLDVLWLCSSHHAEAHGRKTRTGKPKKHYDIPCWLANAKPSSEHYDAPAIVETLTRLWIKQQQVMDVTRLKRKTVVAIVNGDPVDDTSLAIMLRYVEVIKQQRAA